LRNRYEFRFIHNVHAGSRQINFMEKIPTNAPNLMNKWLSQIEPIVQYYIGTSNGYDNIIGVVVFWK